MAEDHHVGRGAGEITYDLRSRFPWAIEDVGEEEPDAFQLDARRFAGLPAAEPIDVPGHRGHRSDPLQIPQDLDVPDVAGVEDVARAGECRADLGPQEPVGVGEDADAHPIFLPGVAGPCNKP